MKSPVDVTIRPVEEHELGAFGRAAAAGFGSRFDIEHFEQQRAGIECGRSLAAFEGDEIVGTAEAMATTMSVPGGADLATAGIKGITVLPTHRRRGILTALMQRQVDDLAAWGEALAVLWATESGIYPRFGYGIATYRLSTDIEKVHATLAHEPTDKELGARLIDEATSRVAIAEGVYEAKRRDVPGMIRRTEPFWIRRREDLLGAGNFFVAIERSGHDPRAYATYRIDRSWGEFGPEGNLSVIDAIALDADAERALWGFILNLDLVTTISAWQRPIDDPLPHLLVDPRRLRQTVGEGAWLRIIDVPAALAQRHYWRDIDLKLKVTDAMRPQNHGTWHLQGGEHGATCAMTAEEADLELDISTLSSAYLGHPSLGSPAAAGLVVEHRAGALRQAAAAFCWSPAPWAVTWF